MTAPTAPVWVRVPASTSNLGPGFDVLGLALDLFLEARFAPGLGTFHLVREGTLEELNIPPHDDLLLRTMVEVLAAKPLLDDELRERMEDLPRGRLTVRSEIPVGRGLGSSAAARIAGYVLGHLLRGTEPTRGEAVAWATRREGHPDNAAPAVLGGLMVSFKHERSRVESVRLPLSPGLAWVYAAPEVPLSTQEAREVLPRTVDHDAAVRNTGRLARLLPALANGDGAALGEAMEDELHVPFRLPLVPGGEAARRAGLGAGAWGVTLSGAGSGLIAVTPRDRAAAVGQAMAAAFQEAEGSGGGFFRVVRPCEEGMTWGQGEPTPPDPARP